MKQIEIEENREKARLKQIQLDLIKENTKKMEEERKEQLQQQQVAIEEKLAENQRKKLEDMKIKRERDQIE